MYVAEEKSISSDEHCRPPLKCHPLQILSPKVKHNLTTFIGEFHVFNETEKEHIHVTLLLCSEMIIQFCY